MKRGDKIGSGLYRDCFEVPENPNLCVKVQRDRVTREIPELGISVDVRMEIFLLLKFGELDLNILEYETISSLPDCLRQFTPSIVHLDEDSIMQEKSQLIMSRPRDFDGAYSRTMQEYGGVANVDFWDQVDLVAESMLRYDLFSPDIFYRGQNIIVQRDTPTTYRPVLIDTKHMGRAMFHVRQPWLIFKSERLRAFHKNLDEFKGRFHLRGERENKVAA